VIENEWFEKLSAEIRADILLFKAKEYFNVLDELYEMVNGQRPTLKSGMAFACDYNNWHNRGTKYNCELCAVYMTEILVKKLPQGNCGH